MDRTEFAWSRAYLEKSQTDLARLLGVSLKGVQSFEQGWRSVPVHVERQLLLLLSLKAGVDSPRVPCWDSRECDLKIRERCVVWELKAGHMCWFIAGTTCDGVARKDWQEKMQECRTCGVFRALVPAR
jgi:DNA-binding XRE family transcriptional regulator